MTVPGFGDLVPMHPARGDEPFDSEEHAFEPKLDGIRALAYAGDAGVRLQLRSGREATRRYPDVIDGVTEALHGRRVVLDGELCALDPRGVPALSLVMTREGAAPDRVEPLTRQQPVVYYVFDVLWADGDSLLTTPWHVRKTILDDLLPSAPSVPNVRVVRPLPVPGVRAYRASLDAGLEGVVAKRRESPYRPGARSDDWMKIKRRDLADVVVGAWTPGTGALEGTVGALVVGAYESGGGLVALGKVGTGLRRVERDALRDHFTTWARATNPFARGGLPPEARFVTPRLVVEVAFHEVTGEGKLRAPRVVRVRPDKPPTDCRLEDVMAGAPVPRPP